MQHGWQLVRQGVEMCCTMDDNERNDTSSSNARGKYATTAHNEAPEGPRELRNEGCLFKCNWVFIDCNCMDSHWTPHMKTHMTLSSPGLDYELTIHLIC